MTISYFKCIARGLRAYTSFPQHPTNVDIAVFFAIDRDVNFGVFVDILGHPIVLVG